LDQQKQFFLKITILETIGLRVATTAGTLATITIEPVRGRFGALIIGLLDMAFPLVVDQLMLPDDLGNREEKLSPGSTPT
jgi:hypothetical protein